MNMQPWKSGSLNQTSMTSSIARSCSRRIVAGDLPHRAVPRLRFPFVAPLHGGDHQVVLALEVLVEGGLGHARRVDDLVDADRAEPVAVEELDRPPRRAARARSWADRGDRRAPRPISLRALGMRALARAECSRRRRGVYLECTVRARGARTFRACRCGSLVTSRAAGRGRVIHQGDRDVRHEEPDEVQEDGRAGPRRVQGVRGVRRGGVQGRRDPARSTRS